jgi:hypothetical protein
MYELIWENIKLMSSWDRLPMSSLSEWHNGWIRDSLALGFICRTVRIREIDLDIKFLQVMESRELDAIIREQTGKISFVFLLPVC